MKIMLVAKIVSWVVKLASFVKKMYLRVRYPDKKCDCDMKRRHGSDIDCRMCIGKDYW